MQRVLSTYRFVNQPLDSNLLAEIARAHIPSIEVFCVQSHFNYRTPQAVRELVEQLQEHHLQLHSLHAPTERDLAPGRESAVSLSLSDPERVRRLDAMDEVKRALEVAEHIPFRFLVQHLGHGRAEMDSRRMDAAFNSLEYLMLFAKHRGVTIALENTPCELASPANLCRFIRETHLHDLRLCFDSGHAHMEEGVESSFEIMRERIATTHLHDNHGSADEHLLPFEGTIAWNVLLPALAALPQRVPFVLELKQSGSTPSLEQTNAVFERMESSIAAKRVSAGGA